MVWTYDQVKELRKKMKRGEKITKQDKRNLQKYVKIKRQVADLPGEEWSRTQLLRAEYLLNKIEQQELIEVKTV